MLPLKQLPTLKVLVWRVAVWCF